MNTPAPQTIAVIDYGMGNLRSVAQAAQRAAQDLPVRIIVTHEAQAVREAQLTQIGRASCRERV